LLKFLFSNDNVAQTYQLPSVGTRPSSENVRTQFDSDKTMIQKLKNNGNGFIGMKK